MNKIFMNLNRKEVNGIPFGTQKEDIRNKFGNKTKITSTVYESKNGNCSVDILDGVKFFYNENGEFISAEIDKQSEVYVGNKKVFPTSISESSKNLGSDFKRKAGEYIAENSCAKIIMNGNCMDKIIFYKDLPTLKTSPEKMKLLIEKTTPMTESIGDIHDPEAFEIEKRKSLTNLYDDLKSEMDKDPSTEPAFTSVTGPDAISNASNWMNKANIEANKLRDHCHKQILLDIYCKILPLDDDYKNGNQGEIKADINAMLSNKGLSATQYLQSCSDATKAPLVEFVLRAGDIIANQFLEDAKETLDDAKKNDISVPDPEADVEDPEIEEQLVDVKQDGEYENFIDELKKKTINKIVNDVSKIITDKKEEQNMIFDPKPLSDEIMAAESTVSVGLNYLNNSLLKENISLDERLEEEMIGMAIRESTLNIMDLVFKQPGSDFKNYFNRIKYGKGVLINESAKTYFIENSEQPQGKRYEPLYKEVDGNKYDISNYEKVDGDGKKTPMSDQEAKKVLDPEGYKGYQNRNKSN